MSLDDLFRQLSILIWAAIRLRGRAAGPLGRGAHAVLYGYAVSVMLALLLSQVIPAEGVATGHHRRPGRVMLYLSAGQLRGNRSRYQSAESAGRR